MNGATTDILLIEDNPGDARLVREMLRNRPEYLVSHAVDLASGLRHLATQPVNVILLDLSLPDSHGTDTLQDVLGRCGETPVVVFTGNEDERAGAEAIREGAQDYLSKDRVDEFALVRSIRYAIERGYTRRALQKTEAEYRSLFEHSMDAIYIVSPDGGLVAANQAWLDLFGYSREELPALSADDMYADPAEQASFLESLAVAGRASDEVRLKRKNGSIVICQRSAVAKADGRGTYVAQEAILRDVTTSRRAESLLAESYAHTARVLQGTLDVVQQMTEARDPYTAGHQKRSAELAVAIARHLHLPEESCVSLVRTAALIHDVGKIVVPAEMLSKPGRLTKTEMQLVRAHSEAGYDILKRAELPQPVPEIVLQHHERIDGSGYPQSLAGDDILPEAQILAVADVVEAMSSHRPYRPALGIEAALAEISAGSGTRYYPDVVNACLAVFRDQHFSFSQ